MFRGCNLVWRHWARKSPFPSVSLLMSIAMTTLLLLGSIGECSSTLNISTGKYSIYHQKAKPADVSSCWTETSNTGLFCLHLCSRNISCAAVYFHYDIQISTFQCYLCQEVLTIFSLLPGEGHYSVSKFGARGQPAPAIDGATLEKVDDHLGKMAAFYSCPAGSTSKEFELTFNDQQKKWPELSADCRRSLCDTESVQGVMMTVSEPLPGRYRLHPNCPHDERAHGYLECSGSSWKRFDSLNRICIPTKCQSMNSGRRSVYQGILNTTPTGRTCQRWSKISPHLHFYGLLDFLEDTGSNVENFCRDPDNDGYVWCYTTDPSKRWEKCAVPKCP